MVAHKINLPLCSFNHLQWIVMSILLLQVVLAEAGEYTLDKKENNFILPDDVKNICTDYVKNLNKFDEPMVCNRKIDPDMTAFSRPKWKPIDPNKHPELLDELARFWVYEDERWNQIKKEDENNKIIYYKERLHKRAKAGALVWHLGHFDLDNDGKEDSVLHTQSIEYQCDPEKNFITPYHGKILMLKKDNGLHIDMELTKYIYISSWNIFQYKGRTFFDLWSGRDNGKEAEIQVYYPLGAGVVSGIGNHLICWIKYNTK